MCEIQFFKRLDNKNLSEKDTLNFLKFMNLGDMGNLHAFGFFNSKKIFKKDGRFNYRYLDDKEISSDSFVVGHNRFATTFFGFGMKEPELAPASISSERFLDENSLVGNPFFTINASSGFNGFSGRYGFNFIDFFLNLCRKKEYPTCELEKNKENDTKQQIKNGVRKKEVDSNIQNHPFQLGDLVLVHNGGISNYFDLAKRFNLKSDINTDSYIILFLIHKFFKESKLDNRRKKMVEAIQKTVKLIDGSYSVFVFDKVSKDLFYFKEPSTSFAFTVFGKRLLVGSTNKNNFKYIFNFKIKDGIFQRVKMKRKSISKKKLFIPKSNVIYLIGNKEGEILKKIAKFNDVLEKGNKIELEGGDK